jgi:drug/metabolite transporter (DMT)-like permease
MAVWIGTLLASVSAVSWALANVAIQNAARRLGSWGALVWSQVIGGAAALVAALLIEGAPGRISTAELGAMAIGGVAALVAYAGLFESLRRGQVAVVTPIMSAWSVVSVMIGVLWFHEPIGLVRALGIAVIVTGNVLVARSGPRAEGAASGAMEGTLGWLGWALLAMFGFGIMVPAVEVAGRGIGRLWAVPAVWTVELAIGIPLLWKLGLLRRVQGQRDWRAVGSAALLEAIGFVAVSVALGVAPVAVVSPIASLSTAGSVVLGVLVLRERLAIPVLIGATLACAGVVLVNVSG